MIAAMKFKSSVKTGKGYSKPETSRGQRLGPSHLSVEKVREGQIWAGGRTQEEQPAKGAVLTRWKSQGGKCQHGFVVAAVNNL